MGAEVAGEFTYHGAVANRAIELLGKEIGMFMERREQGKPGELAHLSDAELVDKVLMDQLTARGLSEPLARAVIENEPGRNVVKLRPVVKR